MNFWFEVPPPNIANLKLPLNPTDLVNIRRNVEKFLENVIPPTEIGSFLRSLTLNRWEVVEQETQEHKNNLLKNGVQ